MRRPTGIDASGSGARPDGDDPEARAREFAAPLIAGRALATGENVLAHAEGTATILASIGAPAELRAAAFLVHAADELGQPDEVLTPLFGASLAKLVAHARKIGDLQRTAQGAQLAAADRARQTERVRKMLLAFSRDLRVVLLRLASRLQTLRFFAAAKLAVPARAGGRGDAGVRAARQPPGHLADQVGARGPGLPLPRARQVSARSRACSTSAGSIAKRGWRVCATSSPPIWRPMASRRRCRAGPSTSTASGRRWVARTSTSPA